MEVLCDTYLFEDFLMEVVAGRRLNLNRNDDSCVFVAKPKQEVSRRLERSHPRPQAEGARILGQDCLQDPGHARFGQRTPAVLSGTASRDHAE